MDGAAPRLEPSVGNPWTCLERRYVYDGGSLRVRRDQVVAPDGRTISYEFVEPRSSGFSVIVPLDEGGQVYLVRQWRYPWGESSWELPAGHLEAGESPLAAAQRELAEEAGFAADAWQPLAELRNSASLAVKSYLYLARGLHTVGTAREGSERDMELRRLPLEDAVAAAAMGEIVHAVSISALFLAQRAVAAP